MSNKYHMYLMCYWVMELPYTFRQSDILLHIFKDKKANWSLIDTNSEHC